jgi:hypothetical protein
VHGSALTFRNGEISRRVKAWTLRLALTLTVGLVFTVWSSAEAHAVSNVDYFPFGSSFCVGERATRVRTAGLPGQQMVRLGLVRYLEPGIRLEEQRVEDHRVGLVRVRLLPVANASSEQFTATNTHAVPGTSELYGGTLR